MDSGHVKVNQKVSFSVLLFFNISFEPEFGNSSFESLEKQNIFNFQLTFSAIVDFILWFGTRHYSRFGVFLFKIGMHVKTVQIELFAIEIIIRIHISSLKKVLPKYEN